MGSKTVTCSGTSGGKYNLTINYWYNWQDTAQNISNIYVEVTLQRNDGYAGSYWNLYENQNSVYLDVNGSRVVAKNMKIDTRNSAVVTLASWSGNIPHNADGSKTVALGGGFTFQSNSLSSGSVSDNFVLPTIPRKSDFTISPGTLEAGNAVTVNISPASSNFTHRVTYTFGGNSSNSTLSAGNKTSTKTIPLSWLNAIPNSTSGTASVKVETLSGGVVIGETTKYFTVTCPASVLPSISSVIASRIDNNVPADWGIYVKGESQARVNASASGIYGSTITSWQITGAGYSSSSSTMTTGALNTAGIIPFTVKVTDSRGRSVTHASTSITVEDYSPPSMTLDELYRCDADGTRNNNGNYLSVKASVTYTEMGGKNAVSLSYKIARKGQTPGSYTPITPGAVTIIQNVSSDYSYTLYLLVADRIHDAETKVDVATAVAPVNFAAGGKGIGLGKVSEKDGLEVAFPVYFEKDVSIGNITGLLKGTNGTVGQAEAGEDYVTPAQFDERKISYGNDGTSWYIKFYDGTMICYCPRFSATTNSDGAFLIPFPQSFIGNPSVTVNPIARGSQMQYCSIADVGNSTVSLFFISANASHTNASVIVSYQAIGRWK